MTINIFNLSIIIPFYKRDNYVLDILNTIDDENTRLNLNIEIIFIDSNSSNLLNSTLSNYKFLSKINAKVINTSNNPVSKRNLGIVESQSEYIIAIDDDCIPQKNFIKKHVEKFEDNNDDKIIYSGLVSFSKELCDKSNYYRFRNDRHRAYDQVFKLDNNIYIHNFITMNMSFKKNDLIKEKLLFDEDYITYGLEDTQFALDAINKGFILKTCNAEVIHQESTSIDLFIIKIKNFTNNFCNLFYQKNREYFENEINQSLDTNNIAVSYKSLIQITVFYNKIRDKFPFLLKFLRVIPLFLSPISLLLKTFLKISDNRSILYSYWAYKILVILTIISTLFDKKLKTKDFI